MTLSWQDQELNDPIVMRAEVESYAPGHRLDELITGTSTTLEELDTLVGSAPK